MNGNSKKPSQESSKETGGEESRSVQKSSSQEE
jgi:hypothetical protein